MSSTEGGKNSFINVLGALNSKDRRRSQRVLLQVAVLIGVDVRGGERRQTQAFTLSVNAHGGLLESALGLNTGQPITLTNPRTKKEVGGRVVRVEGSSESSFRIAFEFALPNPQFWSINIPTDRDLRMRVARDSRLMGDARELGFFYGRTRKQMGKVVTTLETTIAFVLLVLGLYMVTDNVSNRSKYAGELMIAGAVFLSAGALTSYSAIKSILGHRAMSKRASDNQRTVRD